MVTAIFYAEVAFNCCKGTFENLINFQEFFIINKQHWFLTHLFSIIYNI